MLEIRNHIIKSYCVDLENQKITINTEYIINNKKEITTIEFDKVMAYLFKNGLKWSILFDIKHNTLDHFVRKHDTLLKQEENYGWPFVYKNETEIIAILQKNNQNYYEINSAYGLCGWVLAETLHIISITKPVD